MRSSQEALPPIAGLGIQAQRCYTFHRWIYGVCLPCPLQARHMDCPSVSQRTEETEQPLWPADGPAQDTQRSEHLGSG